MVPQPMGNRPIYNPQSIPPPVSQPVGPNLIYTINSQPSHAAQATQVPLTISQSINATPAPHLSTISQSYAMPAPHQSQSIPAPHDHSVHNIPDGTTLPMLNPWQKQANLE